jgi:hypothetical protein
MSEVQGEHIVQEHTHILCMRYVNGKYVNKCIHHECEYEEEITPSQAWENEL